MLDVAQQQRALQRGAAQLQPARARARAAALQARARARGRRRRSRLAAGCASEVLGCDVTRFSFGGENCEHNIITLEMTNKVKETVKHEL